MKNMNKIIKLHIFALIAAVLFAVWIPVTVKAGTKYPVKTIFEYEKGLRFSFDGEELYSGWLTKVKNSYVPEKRNGNYEVYYFDLATPESTLPRALTGERIIEDKRYLFGSDGVLIKEWYKLESVEIEPIEVDPSSGVIADNTVTLGSSIKLTAKLLPVESNDSRDPEWEISDSASVKITNDGYEYEYVYATLDVLEMPENASEPVNIKLTAGEDVNRITTDDEHDLNLYITYPVGWQKWEGNTYYGQIVEEGDHAKVEFVTGWWPEDYENRNEANKEYLFDENGALVTGLYEIDGVLYDFGQDGVLRAEYPKQGFVRTPDGTVYYDENGVQVTDTIVTDEEGNAYYIGLDGYVTCGYFSITSGGEEKYYYALPEGDGNEGVLQSGWFKVNGSWKFFAKPGSDNEYEEITAKNFGGWLQMGPEDGNKRYYRNNNGKTLTGWQTIDRKKYYFDTDGSVYTGFAVIKGNSYYFGENLDWDDENDEPTENDNYGVLQTGFLEAADGGWHYADASGKFAKGWLSIKRDGKTYRYYFDSDAKLCTGVTDVGGKRYYLKDYIDDSFREPVNNYDYGALQYGDKGIIISEAPEALYYANGQGVLATGWRFASVNGKYTPEYYSPEDNDYGQKLPVEALTGYDGRETGWYKVDHGDHQDMYYISGGKNLKKGSIKVSVAADATHKKDYIFCLDPVSGKYNGEEGSVTVSGKSYFNEEIESPYNEAPGYPHVAIMTDSFFTRDGKTYYTDKNGNLQKGWISIKDTNNRKVWHYFRHSDGAELTDTPLPDGDMMLKRPNEPDGNYWGTISENGTQYAYYFKNNSTLCRNGWQTINRDKYYFDSTGAILSGGVVPIGKKSYLLDDFEQYGRALGSAYSGEDGLVTYEGKQYVTNSSGEILTGWQISKKIRYYCDPQTGVAEAPAWSGDGNWATLSDGSVYYFKSGRTLAKGVTAIDGKKYCFDSTTGRLFKADSGYVKFTSGKYLYEADEDGALTIGWEREGVTDTDNPNTEADYYFDSNARAVTGFYTVKGAGAGYYYFGTDGQMATGITNIKGKKYVLGVNTSDIASSSILSNDRGMLHKNYYGGCTEDDLEGDVRYCSDKNGIMLTGWQKATNDSGVLGWHYFDIDTGREIRGVYDDSGKWYIIHLNKAGRAVRAKFYFGRSGPLKGFNTIGGRKYYFDNTGRLVTGLYSVGKTTYYFNETVTNAEPHIEGMMMTGAVYNVDGNYYRMKANGGSYKGWFTEGGSKYYADPDTGELAVGFRKIGNNVYYFSDVASRIGQMQTGFIKLYYNGQRYYDKTGLSGGASNLYYADKNGVVAMGGWKNVMIEPKLSDSQEWSYYLNPEAPGIDMGDFILTGEVTIGDVLLDDSGLVTFLDDGLADNDGFEAVGGAGQSDIDDYYRFDSLTGARRKTVMYFYGNYYGMSIDANQRRTISTMRRYVNTDMKYSTESDDFVIINGGSDFPMCASNSVEDEKESYVASNDLNGDGHVDVLDVELYSKAKYDEYIDKYGPRNLVLMGASSGAGICLGLYDYAIEKGDSNKLPEQVLLLSPWVDVSMSNSECKKLSVKQTGPTDVATLRYWGARYTRDGQYTDDESRIRTYKDIAGVGVNYAFASSVKLSKKGRMNNIIMYCGAYDPCRYDSKLFADAAKAAGAKNVIYNLYSGEQHGFMFFAADKNAVKVTVDACRRIMTQLY